MTSKIDSAVTAAELDENDFKAFSIAAHARWREDQPGIIWTQEARERYLMTAAYAFGRASLTPASQEAPASPAADKWCACLKRNVANCSCGILPACPSTGLREAVIDECAEWHDHCAARYGMGERQAWHREAAAAIRALAIPISNREGDTAPASAISGGEMVVGRVVEELKWIAAHASIPRHQQQIIDRANFAIKLARDGFPRIQGRPEGTPPGPKAPPLGSNETRHHFKPSRYGFCRECGYPASELLMHFAKEAAHD